MPSYLPKQNPLQTKFKDLDSKLNALQSDSLIDYINGFFTSNTEIDMENVNQDKTHGAIIGYTSFG